MIASVKAEDCVKMEDPLFLNCKLSGKNEGFDVGLYINESNQNIVKELTINGFVLYNLSNAFVKLTNLDKIIINSCTGLSSKNQTFSNQQLSYIEITSTDLEFVSEHLFSELSTLETLKMNKNKIKEIHKDAFKDQVKLETIEMDQNKIESLPDNVFVNNLNLKTISCQDNKIKKLTLKTFSGCLNVSKIQLQNNWIDEIEENFTHNLSPHLSIDFNENICIKTYLSFIQTANENELKKCYLNYVFNQKLEIMTNNFAASSTVKPLDNKVNKSVKQLEQELMELRDSKSRHQYFIYSWLLLLTALVIYEYLFMYRRFYHKLGISRNSTSETNVQLM